jgi:hypothetical protein
MQQKENLKTKGVYTFISLKNDPNHSEMSSLRRFARGDKSALSGFAHLLNSNGIQEVANLTPTIGRNVLTRLLSGDTTYTGEINYGALGDGTTAFNNASTTLNNEIFRKLNSDASYDENIAYIDWFIASGDCADDTYEEFGAFIDGTASADSGQAFSLTITGGWIKSGSMFVSLAITIS